MSVFTRLPTATLEAFLARYHARAETCTPAPEGIENSNFFIHGTAAVPVTGKPGAATDQRPVAWVLTLFEHLGADRLPWYLDMLCALADEGLPVAAPLADAEGKRLHTLERRPAILVPLLQGRHVEMPTTAHCRAVGAALARLHGSAFHAPAEPPFAERAMLAQLAAQLPALPIADRDSAARVLDQWAVTAARLNENAVLTHGDLFRDNVLFNGETLTGLLDFYHAGYELAVYDLAVAMNDWCVRPDGSLDAARRDALLEGYRTVRAVPDADLLPLALETAALRFWLSRLAARANAREHVAGAGSKDPTEFARIFQARRQQR